MKTAKTNKHSLCKPENANIKAYIELQLQKEKKRLQREAGIETEIKHFVRPLERKSYKNKIDEVTLLFGGLTWRHEYLLMGALTGLGYKCDVIPTPEVKGFQLGKEYGNNGQCNPTYFTVGSLIQYLQNLVKKGLCRAEIIEQYAFITIGSCGPCRFGMYEAEYRLALRNSGFDGFRVILLQQSTAIDHPTITDSVQTNLHFVLTVLNAINMGDVLNEVLFKFRPYEVVPGSVNAATEKALKSIYKKLKEQPQFKLTSQGFINSNLGSLIKQLSNKDYVNTLKSCCSYFSEIKLDRFQVKPVVKIIGEFWAQTTEGDGNFNMFRFLEEENAEVLIEPVATWVMYLLAQQKQSIKDRNGIYSIDMEQTGWGYHKKVLTKIKQHISIGRISLLEYLFKREYRRLQNALGRGILHGLVEQHELQRLAQPHYNTRAAGGEGHLEIGKNIYYSKNKIAHMVLSLKPFGCMPSIQSDGVQVAVIEKYRDMIFLPIETSGEGEINAHSRVQMVLNNAKIKAKEEFNRTLSQTEKSLQLMKDYVGSHPQLQSPLYEVPKTPDVVGSAANFVIHVSELMS